MARRSWGMTVALVACGLAAAALSGVTAAPITVVSFDVDDAYPPLISGTGAGVFEDGQGVYADYRINPDDLVNWCVDAEPFSPGNLFVRLNRKLDGEAGVLRCSENPDSGGINLGVPRNITLKIANDTACDLLGDPATGLPLTDSANGAWNPTTSSIPCTLARNDNPRIRLGTLYKARAKTTNIDFLTFTVGAPTSYEIRSDGAASISTVANAKTVTYSGTYHLVQFANGTKAKTVEPPFNMPVRMTFVTSTVP